MSMHQGPLVRLNNTLRTSVLEASFDPRRVRMAHVSDGMAYEQEHTAMREAPTISLVVTDLHEWLGVLSGTYGFVALDGTNGLEVFHLKGASSGPGYSSSSVHQRRRMISGLVCLNELSWSPDAEARASLTAYGISSDGTTNPAIVTDNNALPTFPTVSRRFVLQALTIAGDTITRVRSLRIAIDPRHSNSDAACYNVGLPFPTTVLSAGPMGPAAITLEAELNEMEAATGEGSGAVTATFRDISGGGAVGTRQVAVTINGGYAWVEGTSANGQGPVSKRLVVTSRHDGTNLPLTIAVTGP